MKIYSDDTVPEENITGRETEGLPKEITREVLVEFLRKQDVLAPYEAKQGGYERDRAFREQLADKIIKLFSNGTE